MAGFRVNKDKAQGYGRLGTLDVSYGPVETPAMFPVINLIGGTTLDSGSGWRYFRDNIVDEGHLQGIMFQAMSFLDYGVSPNTLPEWREETIRNKLKADGRAQMDTPVFIDSGGFSLMNSETFGPPPEEGGPENEWGLYTNPDSILNLQTDFGGDIIATLDFPIPPDLREDEKTDRMERSIESAIRCLQLLDDPDKIKISSDQDRKSVERLKAQKKRGEEPAVFVAIHGHDYETINWYVGSFLERVAEEDISQSIQGFAIGSLVPLRSKTEVLVDIIQGAKDAIPEERRDDLALHVFGVGGKLASLLALLGVDTFDCSSHMQAARFKKYLIPDTWEHVQLNDSEVDFRETDGDFPCSLEHCTLCGPETDLTPETLIEQLNREPTYGQDGRTKAKYYGELARHNFEVYNDEVQRVRNQIQEGTLLDYVIDFARRDDDIRNGLEYIQFRNSELKMELENREAYDLVAGLDIETDQSRLTDFGGGVEELSESRKISLEYGPNDFNILRQNYQPPEGTDVLLLLPCSQQKPYSDSRTHSVVMDRIESVQDRIHKVTVSGMYGPVPESKEQDDAVLHYNYVLAEQDKEQIELVTDRVIDYLERYGDGYNSIIAYATSKNYREVLGAALESYGHGLLLPRNPSAQRLTEHFRRENIKELMDELGVESSDFLKQE